jgi:hypothetical protein
MKILGGVPTRKRKIGGQVADILAEVCEEVLVVSQGAEVVSHKSNVHIIEKPVDIGMKAARNTIFDYADEVGAEFIIQSDDDLKFRPSVLEKMIEIMLSEPSLGSLSSCPRVYHNWEKSVTSSKEWLVFQCPTQLWIVRNQAIHETGQLDIDVLEDIELGLRMWKQGWVLAKLHSDIEFTHNPVINRMGKGDDQGGQPESLRKAQMPDSVEYIWNAHNDILRAFSLSTAANRTYSARYDWGAMCDLAYNRWGTIGYEDSKGRII